MNLPELLRLRDRVLAAVRGFFHERGFTEVETPLLVPSPGLEPHLDPFVVVRPEPAPDLFLPTSPEYAMKRLLAAGSGDVFQICKAFRDEPPSDRHLPEFTLLEWYRVGADYRALMDDCEQLGAHLARAVYGSAEIPWQGDSLDLAPPYERLDLREAFRRHAGLDLTFRESADRLRRLARGAGCTDVADDDPWDDLFFKMFLRHVERHLGRGKPTLLLNYPARMAALSRIRPDDPHICERFELYAGGLELANAFTELTDPAEQRRRLHADNARRRELGKPPLPVDEDFLGALERGLPDCAGIALGLDRLIMLLADEPDVRRVVALPPPPDAR
jgi:lysyl-tRNA synthetase class 2